MPSAHHQHSTGFTGASPIPSEAEQYFLASVKSAIDSADINFINVAKGKSCRATLE
jgi:hypothetical protein